MTTHQHKRAELIDAAMEAIFERGAEYEGSAHDFSSSPWLRNQIELLADQIADIEAAKAHEVVEALTEIERRTGLLIHQNTGRWDCTVEHDARTIGVLNGNQRIAADALKRWEETSK